MNAPPPPPPTEDDDDPLTIPSVIFMNRVAQGIEEAGISFEEAAGVLYAAAAQLAERREGSAVLSEHLVDLAVRYSERAGLGRRN
jgi:hypothetical protein